VNGGGCADVFLFSHTHFLVFLSLPAIEEIIFYSLVFLLKALSSYYSLELLTCRVIFALYHLPRLPGVSKVCLFRYRCELVST
jgi:hypothetical protein